MSDGLRVKDRVTWQSLQFALKYKVGNSNLETRVRYFCFNRFCQTIFRTSLKDDRRTKRPTIFLQKLNEHLGPQTAYYFISFIIVVVLRGLLFGLGRAS